VTDTTLESMEVEHETIPGLSIELPHQISRIPWEIQC